MLGWCPFAGVIRRILFSRRILFNCRFFFGRWFAFGAVGRFALLGDSVDQPDRYQEYGNAEYQDNDNLTLSDRATGCGNVEKPVGNL